MSLRGPRTDVDQVAILLNKRMKELVESNYSQQINIPQKFHRAVIGRDGVTIKQLRDSTQTRIDIPTSSQTSDQITITGKAESVELAISKIQNIVKKEVGIFCVWLI